MKLKKSIISLSLITGIVFIFSIISCEIGMGAAVDIADPTISVTYPPKNAVVRDTFIASGECSDDMSVSSVKVTLMDTDTRQTYGPYKAELDKKATTWTVSLNQKTPENASGLFDSYKQWVLPDGNYVINATAYDQEGKSSPVASSPISIDNTAPVLIVSKPLAIGSNPNEAATIYGRSFKLSGDIAEDHETSKLVLYYRPYNSANGAFSGDLRTIEVTDTQALNAMSSSNPLVIAQFEGDGASSEQHQKYISLYCSQPGDTCTSASNEDKYYYGGFLIEDNAKIYQSPGDEGSGTGNQTVNYYILSDEFKDNLAVNYSLTAPRLKDIFKGQSTLYSAQELSEIATILSTTGNYAASQGLVNSPDADTAIQVSSKFSINPHNYPTWALDEYAIATSTVGNTDIIKSYTAGSSLILSINAGRDASYPNPQSVTADLYDMGEYSITTDYFAEPTSTPIPLIGAGGIIAERWEESADDTVKTYTFTLDTQANSLLANHIYQVKVSGVDRNGVAMEPEIDPNGKYVFNLSTSNNIPKVTINSPEADKTFGVATEASGKVNDNGVTITGWVDTDGVNLRSVAAGGIRVKSLNVTDVANSTTVMTTSDFSFSIPEPTPDTTVTNRYLYSIHITGSPFVYVPANDDPDNPYESKYLYTAVIAAKDAVDSEGEKTVKFYVDNKKPLLTISPVTPTVSETTGNGASAVTTEYVNGTVTISGVASDGGNTGSGLKSISYEVLNGTQTVINPTAVSLAESWNFKLETKNLTDLGTYTVKVHATDTLDNVQEETTTIRVKQATDKPQFTPTNASDVDDRASLGSASNMFGTITNNKLYGTITDDDGLGRVTFKYVPADNPDATPVVLQHTPALSNNPKSYSFECPLPSTQGEYKILVEVKDMYAVQGESDASKRQSTSDTYNNDFYITVDDGAPVFNTVTPDPQTNETTYIMGSKGTDTRSLSVTGSVTEGNDLHRNASNVLDGITRSPASSNITINNSAANGYTFTDSIQLPSTSGTSQVTYTAKDKYNQTSTYVLKYSVDVSDPGISSIKIGSADAITNPYANQTHPSPITSNSIKIEVMASDDHSGISTVEYSKNPEAATPEFTSMTHASSEDTSTAEKWTANIAFDDGDAKKLKIRVKDRVGNFKESAIITMQVDKTKPVLDVKWYKVAESAESPATAGTLQQMPATGIPEAFVHTKDLVIFGNYSDGENGSGVRKLRFKIGDSEVTPGAVVSGSTIPGELHYFNTAFTDETTLSLIEASIADVMEKTDPNNPSSAYVHEVSYSEANSKSIRSFVAVIDHTKFSNGDLVIYGPEDSSNSSIIAVRDNAGNKIDGETKTVMSIVPDTEVPRISSINISMVKTEGGQTVTKRAYKGADNNYYIRNTLDGKLKVTGITTDDHSVDKTEISIFDAEGGTLSREPDTRGNWTFDEIDLSEWEKNSNASNPDATIELLAYDKAGNICDVETVQLIFDEKSPEVLTGGTGGQDEDDVSNPYLANYKLRGADVEKYHGIKIGNGEYSASSYGRDSSVPLSVTFVDEERRSGIARIEYKMLSSEEAGNSTVTANSSSWTDSGNFDEITETTYTHFDASIQDYLTSPTYPCFVGKKTIGGFTRTVSGTPNYVFVRAIDNCGNEGEWFELHIQVDDSIPVLQNDENPETILTNGKPAGGQLQALTGTITDVGAGLKGLVVKVDGRTAFTVSGSGNTNTTQTLTDTSGEGYGTFTYSGFRSETDSTACSLADAAGKVTWTLNLTPQTSTGAFATWFNRAKNRTTAPLITIEAEDWAEDSSRSGNKNTLLVTSLDIDTDPPSAEINRPVNSALDALNGTHKIEGTVTETHTPYTVELRYSVVASTSTASPSALGDWTLLHRFTSAEEPASNADPNTEYAVSPQDLYSFSYEKNFNDFVDELGNDEDIAYVRLLVYTEDKAGNANLGTTVTSSDYRTYKVDKDSDRPIVTVTNTELVQDIGTTSDQPLSTSNYKMLDRNTINIKVEDDDGIYKDSDGKKLIWYRTTYQNETSEWVSIDLVQNPTPSIPLSNNGRHNIEFRIKDGEGTVFTSSGTDDMESTSVSVSKIYLKDMAQNVHLYGGSGTVSSSDYGQPIVYVNVDTEPPVVNIDGIQRLNASKEVTEANNTEGNPEWITGGYSNKILGGPKAKYLKIKVSASDSGSGLDSVELTGKLNSTAITTTAVEASRTNLSVQSGTYELIIPCTVSTIESDDANLTATITVKDKAGKTATESLTFKADNKLPEISVTSPASSENLSGSITANGLISNNESTKFWYAISPIAASPDTYAGLSASSYNFVKYNSSDVATTVNLPTTDKAGNAIAPSSALKTLCAYQPMSDREMVSFSLWFDGKTDGTATGIHSETLNTWLKNIGITTDNDLRTPTNPFADVVRLYFHIKAEDASGNVNELHYPIRVDPLGTRPTVNIGYPSAEKAGEDTDGLTIGGKPTVIGTANGINVVDYVWLQVDCNADDAWTAADFNTLLALTNGSNPAYTLGNMQTKQLVTTALASNADATDYAIRINVTGINWTQKINIGDELNPASGSTQKRAKIWAYATDLQGFTSSPVARKLIIDSDSPVIEQDIKLVKWNTGFNGSNGFTVDADGNIVFEDGAYSAVRTYTKGESIKGQWNIIGKVKDDSGIKTIKYKVNSGTTETAITTPGQSYEANGVYLTPVSETNSEGATVSNYLFSFPIGDITEDAVNEYSIEFIAEENKDVNNPAKAQETFTVLYDNRAPVITEILTDVDTTQISSSNPLEIVNSNGVFSFGGKASEAKVSGVKQTGVARIAFYFTRNCTGHATKIYDPMIRAGRTGNEMDYSTLGTPDSEDHLYWKSESVTSVTGAAVEVASIPSFVHKGGLAKVNGVIYRIEDFNATTNIISLSGAPGDATSIKFAIANVVDNPTREGEGDTRITADYGWGYYSNGSFDDDDLMVESLIEDDTVYTWEANINSRNISDGPVTLNYVVFDNAGNATALKTVECFVKNNQPRLAGVSLGTDEDGNGVVDDVTDTSTYTEFTTYHIYDQGYNGSSKITYLTVPVSSTVTEPESVFKVKGKTVIKPEIVGGNGEISYTYTVTKRNGSTPFATGTDWQTSSYVQVTDAITLGDGTEDDDDSYVDLSASGGIQLDVIDFLNNSIVDGNFQKFSFTINDSTPGLTGTASQSATLDVIMDVALNDTTPATNKIIPFYWKGSDNNSLKENSTSYGHIELSKDLPSSSFASGNTGVYTLNPKVSGAIKLEGIAQDNILLEELSVSVSINDITYPFVIAKYYTLENGVKVYGEWHPGSGTGWSASITEATYEDFKNAGYITTYPAGKEGTDTVPYTSQEYGHVVHWTMVIDTQALGLTPSTGVEITVSAADKGTPSLTGVAPNQTVSYSSTTFNYNGDATPAQTGGELGNNTNADGTAAKYTSRYLIDIVPYITTIKTKLSTKSKKADTSEYDRTALGHYPVASTETVTMSGFNLTGTISEVYFTSNNASDAKSTYAAAGFTIPENAKSGEVKIVVDNVESLNNLNANDAKGISTINFPAESLYGDQEANDAIANFYNRKPNEVNNCILTDDVIFDIWQFNSNAGQANGGGRVDEVFMRVNPNSKRLGFSFLSSYNKFAAPGNGTSYTNKGAGGMGQEDFRSTNSLAFGWDGKAYAMDAGGGEGQRVHFWIIGTDGTDSGVDIEEISQYGTRQQNGVDNNGNNITTRTNLRYKVRSPSIATSRGYNTNGTANNTTNMYLAYYDSYNDEIRFKSGNTNAMGLFTTRARGGYTCSNSQVIATDKTKNLPTGAAYQYTGNPLGGAGEYVAIDVIPKGTTVNGVATSKDIVVLVWYDVNEKALKYSYNTDPLNYASWQSDAANTNTAGTRTIDSNYRGLNRHNWEDAKTIFEGAGEYCQIKVDQTGGIHIAAYDSVYGDLRYAYLPSYNATYTESTMSYTVDSNGNTGSHLVLDVAYDKAPTNNPATTGKAVPYISYWGSGMPKIAYMKSSTPGKGTENDMFTGEWEVSYIPASNKISDLDQKKLGNLDNRINVALWKYAADGSVTDLVSAVKTTGTSTADAASGTIYGNGTANPVVGYSISPTSTDDRIETAQMK